MYIYWLLDSGFCWLGWSWPRKTMQKSTTEWPEWILLGIEKTLNRTIQYPFNRLLATFMYMYSTFRLHSFLTPWAFGASCIMILWSLSACESPNCLSHFSNPHLQTINGEGWLFYDPSVGCPASHPSLKQDSPCKPNNPQLKIIWAAIKATVMKLKTKHQVSYKYDEDKSRTWQVFSFKASVLVVCTVFATPTSPKIRLQSSQYKKHATLSNRVRPSSTEFRHVRPWFFADHSQFSMAAWPPRIRRSRHPKGWNRTPDGPRIVIHWSRVKYKRLEKATHRVSILVKMYQALSG